MGRAKTSGRGAAALALLAALAACHDGRIGAAETAAVALTASLQDGSLAARIARMTLAVTAGSGTAFGPIAADLARSGEAWSSYLTGIPAGPGRRFEVKALDAAGAVLASGGGTAEVPAAGVLHLNILLTRQGTNLENQAPVIDYLSASAVEVEPGAEVVIGVSAHDPDPADQITYAWTAACGRFADPAATQAHWTAPLTAGRCRLTIAVSDGQIAVSSSIDVSVRGGRSISGRRLVTHWPDPPAAPITAPAADTATGAPPQVLVRSASGGWSVLPGGHLAAGGAFVEGSFGADGGFVIPGVPAGGYTLCHRPPGGAVVCLDGSADEVDLGLDLLGRADQVSPTASTPVIFSFDALDPWNPMLERIEITSSGANLFDVVAFGPDLRGGLVSARTAEDWLAANGSGGPMNLLGAGDALHVHQLSVRSFYTDGRLHLYDAATHATTLAGGPALVSGQATELAARLEALPLTASLAVDWDPAPFEALRAQLGPAGRTTLGPRPHQLTVGASAHALVAPAPAATGAPSLVSMTLPGGAGRVAGTAWYGRFLPAHWHEWRSVRFEADVAYPLAGASAPWVETAAVEQREPLPVAAGPIAPALAPVSGLRVAGADALLDQAGVGETPVISWNAPATGTPTGYLVELCRLELAAGRAVRTPVLRHLTTAAQVAVPPGILAAGSSYFARVTALVSSVPAAAPYRTANVLARASVLTGTFAP